MKKNIIILALAGILLLSACSSNLSDTFVEEDIVAKAKETVGVINTMDYEAIVNEFRDDLQGLVSPEDFEQALDVNLKNAGEFQEFVSETTYSQFDEAKQNEYATVILKVKYENDTFIYTISMDEDLEITGMWMK